MVGGGGARIRWTGIITEIHILLISHSRKRYCASTNVHLVTHTDLDVVSGGEHLVETLECFLC